SARQSIARSRKCLASSGMVPERRAARQVAAVVNKPRNQTPRKRLAAQRTIPPTPPGLACACLAKRPRSQSAVSRAASRFSGIKCWWVARLLALRIVPLGIAAGLGLGRALDE